MVARNTYSDLLCIIPARGGSKGIPKKNIQILADIPLFVHSIKHAQRSGIPNNHIIVSSDDSDILSISEKYGVVAHRRPDNISGDLSSTESCLLEVANKYDKYETIICLQPTSPIRFPGLIEKCLFKYYTNGYDSLHTVTKIYNFLWMEKFHEGQYRWYSSYDPRNRPMRQQMSRGDYYYFDNGNIYIMDIDMLKKRKCRHGDNIGVIEISMLESMQIDSMEDLEQTRKIFSGLNTIM